MKQTLKKLKGEIDNAIIRDGDFISKGGVVHMGQMGMGGHLLG